MVIDTILDVPSTDADDARRRKLLNIILIGMAALVVVALVVTFVVDITGLGASDEVTFLYLGSVARFPSPESLSSFCSTATAQVGWLASSFCCCSLPPWPPPIRPKRWSTVVACLRWPFPSSWPVFC